MEYINDAVCRHERSTFMLHMKERKKEGGYITSEEKGQEIELD